MTQPQTPAETAELLLYGQWHEDWQVPFAEWCVRRLAALRAAAWILDVDHVDPSWLPGLALLFHADAYIAGVYDVEYERRTIKESAYLNALRGKPGAINHFSEGAGFGWNYEYTFEGNRVSGVNLFVTPSVGANQTNEQWQLYVTRVCNALLPLWIRVNTVTIAQQFRHATEVAAGYQSYEWEATDTQGITTAYSLL